MFFQCTLKCVLFLHCEATGYKRPTFHHQWKQMPVMSSIGKKVVVEKPWKTIAQHPSHLHWLTISRLETPGRRAIQQWTHKESTTLQGTSPYPTLGKGKSSTQMWFLMGYVSSQEGMPHGSHPFHAGLGLVAWASAKRKDAGWSTYDAQREKPCMGSDVFGHWMSFDLNLADPFMYINVCHQQKPTKTILRWRV